MRTYDTLKVNAVLNWIDGYDSTRTTKTGVPAIFGMNFQAVSVGQKLAKAGDADADKTLIGGYLDANATPGNALTLQFQFVDDALGKFLTELQMQRIDDQTLVIVSAKHGQSPIDRSLRKAISDAAYGSAPGFKPNGFEICDDEALVWLSPEMQQGATFRLSMTSIVDRLKPRPSQRGRNTFAFRRLKWGPRQVFANRKGPPPRLIGGPVGMRSNLRPKN